MQQILRALRAVVLTAASSAVVLGAEKSAVPETRKHENWGYNAPDWTVDVPGWSPLQPGEHPRLVFRKTDLDRLKKRAETPEGKVMIERLRKLLDGKFTLWHPAGYGLLFHLSGDKRYAEKAKEQTIAILDNKRMDERDGRYGFYNGNGDLRTGPAIGAMGLAYDMNYDGWDEQFCRRVALAIQDHPATAKISARGPHIPSCNHYGAAVGGVGVGLLAIRGDPGVDHKKIEEMLGSAAKQVRDEISIGYGDRGYYFEGHQCGRISSNTGVILFVQAYRVAAGKNLVAKKDNARWLSAKWIYEFALNPDKSYISPQRGMYCRSFPRGGMWSQQNDFCVGFGIAPTEYVPALKWVYNNQVEPGKEKTYDILEYPHQAVYALANWPLDVQEKNPQDQPEMFPRVMHDTAAGYIVFRNGWSDSGKDICVSVLLGTHPTHQNGRGMAMGGSVYLFGKGFGKGLDWPSAGGQRLPIVFHSSYPIYTRFEADGSGVVSALRYAGMKNLIGPGADASDGTGPGKSPAPLQVDFDGAPAAEVKVAGPEAKAGDGLEDGKASAPVSDWTVAEKIPTSLAVDFSGASGAELLVAMVGPQVGWTVNQWLNLPSRVPQPADLTGQDGYATKTTAVAFGKHKKAYVITMQKGTAPAVKQDGDKVVVGGQTISFDGIKFVLAKTK